MRLSRLRVGGDRRLGVRLGDDVERADLDLDAAELHPLVVLELAGDGDEGAVREAGDRLGHGERGCADVAPSGSTSRVAGFTSCTAPDSSRRMTNCTFF